MPDNVTPAIEETATPKYRTLFIGLGGTGGNVLCNLWARMNAEERSRAHMLYIDTDQRDLLKLSGMGVPSVNIGSSDTVRDIIDFLGPDDGVLDWISTDRKENKYLSSFTHDGASQFRTKSRLCLAKFLKNTDNDLARMLASVSSPGAALTEEPLSVMIVSSIAGGTGAGSFIQVALYLRNYFRDHGHDDISITGMFACPDLFIESEGITDTDQIECMCANAYAAVRELNAMNLVVDGGAHETNEGYGRSIHMEIKTESEGRLFDSHDDLFRASSNYKPYNLIYLMDVANTAGGVLSSMEQYYAVMADVAYTRLYTALEGPLRTGESNELDKHQDYPTAIYGSAGYGRLIYPYEGIVDYLALKKTYDEMDYTWTLLENEWEKYVSNEKRKAKASGCRWSPTSDDRGSRYVSDMMVAMGKTNTHMLELLPMVRNAGSDEDRAADFLARLDAALASASGVANKEKDNAATANQTDGTYGLCTNENVVAARREYVELYSNFQTNKSQLKDAAAIIAALTEFANGAESAVKSYTYALRSAVNGSASFVSSIVAPRNEKDGAMADQAPDELNLFHGLLSLDGQAVHPVAARYLLYSLRKQMKAKLADIKPEDLRSKLDSYGDQLTWALDPDVNDADFINVETRMKQVSKVFFLFRKSAAAEDMNKYLNEFIKAVNGACRDGNNLLIHEVYTRVLEVVEVLIEKYEGLFDNLGQYYKNMGLQLARERDRHEIASDNRCIFISGSRQAKEYLYYADRRTRDVLDASSDEIAAAAGEGVYTALIKRTWKQLEMADNVNLSDGYLEMEEDTFSDMGDVFDGIVAIYKAFLKEKASHLRVNVTVALVRECCRMAGVDESELADNLEKQVKVRSLFEKVVSDVLSKANPMLNFNNVNADPYFTLEAEDLKVRSAILYTEIGMSPAARDSLALVYPGTEISDVQQAFEKKFSPNRGTTVHEDVSDYELIAFKVVHCLQPTQIRKFREDFHHGFYYHYKKRLVAVTSSGMLSKSPHLDKRWHLREAMPYISREMDVAWYRKTARAFVYEILERNMTFTTDDQGVTCFLYPQHGQNVATPVYFPESRLVTISDISRLLEFLQENDELIEKKNQQLDDLIVSIQEIMDTHTEDLPVYKTALSSYPTLRKLRSNLLVRGSMAHTAARTSAQENSSTAMSEKKTEEFKALCETLGIKEADMVDYKKSMGGLLTIAWLVHHSEEKQGRDHDFGECIVDCARDIIEKLCQKMYGSNVTPTSPVYGEYCDLYNSIVEKFMEAYVLRLLSQATNRNMVVNAKNDDDDDTLVTFYRYLKVPSKLTKKAEYLWATEVLPLKNPKAK